VPSVDEYADKVEKLGGKIIVPKKAVPGMGYFIICMDTENNAFGIWIQGHCEFTANTSRYRSGSFFLKAEY
jgi:hypothetical protein